ncbi:TonB-dependent receptor [Sphingomonas alpina]|uniref:TonB-dependent receptor n=2 Tax=Sphingomonas alpina TaxID=653931 RepID=A0A7H0LQY2_9SPHN|nr:TonB-dependent receptor [Sphingomonas alpina]
MAQAQSAPSFRIAPQSLDSALRDFGLQSGVTILADATITNGKKTGGYTGKSDAETALRSLLLGTGLRYTRNGNVFVITPVGNDGQSTATSDSANDDGGDIIVTAQKREESIQDVPIAVSAFSNKALDELKIEGGSELLRAVPNVTFSKTNFASYNFSIRGVGTKALSVSTDPAVAISFNNTPLLRNRLFEQEYFDVERVEVLRGPQGTLYGRNATGGVVNMITNKPKFDTFEGSLKAEVGNYDTRRMSGMINVPLGDTIAIRAAGALTQRDGFDYNSVTDKRVNGRDLWSTRVSAGWEPSSSFKANFIWEHFNEKDDRSRTGKQLCHTDPGPSMIGGRDISADLLTRGILSQSCKPGSLYDDGAFGVPKGFSLPYINAATAMLQFGYLPAPPGQFPDSTNPITMIDPTRDPYAGLTQSRNLREIATAYDPTFRARNDVYQLNLEVDVQSDLRFFSQTAYSKDFYYSTQDYNRFNSGPVFRSSSGLVDFFNNPLPTGGIAPGGVYNDPQLGPSRSILAVDMVKSRSSQWSQEFRLQSSFAGPVNFSVGANYLHFKIDEDYYVFSNLFSALAQGLFGNGNYGGVVLDCTNPPNQPGCVYVDPNPLNKINGQGHNYFRSRNLSKTRSLAAFGELYWQATDDLKLTAGLRYTDDRKTSTPIKTQLLLAPGFGGSGVIGIGFRNSPDIVQHWGRVTGRLVLDWQPKLAFTDETLVYTSYSRGYKGGGANPPSIDGDPTALSFAPLPETFKPESVNAFEIGMKNTLAGGKLTLNANAFFYNYRNYQVSQIVDRIALNENYNANIWGAELEASWRPVPAFRINANLGYLGTRIGKGMRSIDVMNRTQDNPDWVLVKPWLQLASNCVAPKAVVEKIVTSPFYTDQSALAYLTPLCGGSYIGDYRPGSFYSQIFGVTYDPLVDGPNAGKGFYADLGGNELPNSPHWTFNVGAQYTIPFDSWAVTLRSDYYRQSSSWARAYNSSIDRLKAWDNTNLSLTLERPESNLAIQFYVKNVFNDAPITDAFINSDDSGLTTNVFTLDPRIIGFNVTKKF